MNTEAIEILEKLNSNQSRHGAALSSLLSAVEVISARLDLLQEQIDCISTIAEGNQL